MNIRPKVHDTDFNELEQLKEGHSKVRDNLSFRLEEYTAIH